MNKNLFFMLLCCFMLAQSVALGAVSLKRTAVKGGGTGTFAVTYNSSDISGIRAFLMQYSEETQKWNYEVVGLTTEDMKASNSVILEKLKDNLVWKILSNSKVLTSICFKSKSLTGSFDGKYFTNLEGLIINNSQLTSVDVSKNSKLIWLDFKDNRLTSLDVTNNSLLTFLDCSFNKLTSLDVSKNTQLSDLSCYSNQLTSLDVSKNAQLSDLSCYSNQLTSLDVSKNPQLRSLDCAINQLTSLDVSKNPQLSNLSCSFNQLTSLDASKNPQLSNLSCSFNQLTRLNLSNNTQLSDLRCYSNQLTSLNVSKNPQLRRLDCSTNQLTSLELSKNSHLETLKCDSNQLTSLDISRNRQLIYFFCKSNQLTNLDLSKNRQLKYIFCESNELTSLNVSNNNHLIALYCYNNQLRFSSLSGNFLNNTIWDMKLNPQEIIQGGTKGFFELLDLSSEYSVNGTATTYTWYDKVTGQEVGMFAYNGSFYAGPANAGKTLFCKMSNSLYPGLILEYEVTITNSTNALSKTMETSIPENFKFTGPDVGIMELKVYPNPATEVVKISTSMLIGSVTIYDNSGKEIKRLRTVPNNEINVKDLASGGYILAIQTQQGIITKKFIKK